MTTERLIEARNRPWADVETTGSRVDDGPSTREQSQQSRRTASPGRRGQLVALIALLLAAAAIIALMVAWTRRGG